MYKEKTECCGTCAYHCNQCGNWVCTNPCSDLYDVNTEFYFECEFREERS